LINVYSKIKLTEIYSKIRNSLLIKFALLEKIYFSSKIQMYSYAPVSAFSLNSKIRFYFHFQIVVAASAIEGILEVLRLNS